MPPTSRLRRLFQALSALSAVACVLLIALWVRSYWRRDIYHHRVGPAQKLIVNSTQGTLVAAYNTRGAGATFEGWSTASHHPSEYSWQSLGQYSKKKVDVFGFGIFTRTKVVVVVCPILYLVVPFGLASLYTGLYCRVCRFSLRALLIATTLVAVMLGMLAWAAG